MLTPFDALGAAVRCHCPGMGEFDGVELCACPAGEKVLRAHVAGLPVPPMTAEQRAWCVGEIRRFGWTDWDCPEAWTDDGLARAVMASWADYCQHRGI